MCALPLADETLQWKSQYPINVTALTSLFVLHGTNLLRGSRFRETQAANALADVIASWTDSRRVIAARCPLPIVDYLCGFKSEYADRALSSRYGWKVRMAAIRAWSGNFGRLFGILDLEDLEKKASTVTGQTNE